MTGVHRDANSSEGVYGTGVNNILRSPVTPGLTPPVPGAPLSLFILLDRIKKIWLHSPQKLQNRKPPKAGGDPQQSPNNCCKYFTANGSAIGSLGSSLESRKCG